MNPQTYLYACVCVCIGQASSLRSVTLRMKSSPGGAESHFVRWLTAVRVNNNNICSALNLFQTTLCIAFLRKTEKEHLFYF